MPAVSYPSCLQYMRPNINGRVAWLRDSAFVSLLSDSSYVQNRLPSGLCLTKHPVEAPTLPYPTLPYPTLPGKNRTHKEDRGRLLACTLSACRPREHPNPPRPTRPHLTCTSLRRWRRRRRGRCTPGPTACPSTPLRGRGARRSVTTSAAGGAGGVGARVRQLRNHSQNAQVAPSA